MGKASRWLSNLFGLNRRHRRHKPLLASAATCSDGGGSDLDVVQESNKHAVAVAAATAAVAEAALATAKAAAEVVRLTANGPVPVPELHVSRRWSVEDFAAVKIQSAFRGYLARRALKALKGLVKLQALVRGHLVRKRSAEMLRRLQALVRVQGRTRTNRALTSDTAHSERENYNKHDLQIRRTQNPEDSSALKRCVSASSIRSDARTRSNPQLAKNWLDNWVQAGDSALNTTTSMRILRNEDEKCDKILEIDSWKPHSKPKSQRITGEDCYDNKIATSDYLSMYIPVNASDIQKSSANWDVTSLKSVGYSCEKTYNSESKSVYARKSPMTPMRDEWSRNFLGGHPSPNYMAYTKSSRAKSRSQSVPRQRGEYERRGFSKRSLQAFWDLRHSSKTSTDPFTNLSN